MGSTGIFITNPDSSKPDLRIMDIDEKGIYFRDGVKIVVNDEVVLEFGKGETTNLFLLSKESTNGD